MCAVRESLARSVSLARYPHAQAAPGLRQGCCLLILTRMPAARLVPAAGVGSGHEAAEHAAGCRQRLRGALLDQPSARQNQQLVAIHDGVWCWEPREAT